jgi:hypothetical protein
MIAVLVLVALLAGAVPGLAAERTVLLEHWTNFQ